MIPMNTGTMQIVANALNPERMKEKMAKANRRRSMATLPPIASLADGLYDELRINSYFARLFSVAVRPNCDIL